MNPNNRSGSRGLKGVGCLCLLIAAVLLVFGPRNAAGHVLWWWYLIPAFGVALWLAGGKGKVASDAPAQKGIKEWQAELHAAWTADDKEREAKAQLNLGIVYQAAYEPRPRGQAQDHTLLNKAIEHLSRAHGLYKTMGNSDGQGLALCNLAIVYQAIEDDATAAEYFREAVEIAKSLPSPAWEHETVQRYAKLLGQMGHGYEGHKLAKEYAVRRVTQK